MIDRETAITCMRLAVTILILMTFTLAALDKWLQGTAPEWFIDQFGSTWMGHLPQTPMFLSIAFVETVVAVGAFISLVRLEWLRPPSNFLRWTLVGVLFTFIMLGFGARVSGAFEDAATHFAYFAGTLLMFYVVDHYERTMVAEA